MTTTVASPRDEVDGTVEIDLTVEVDITSPALDFDGFAHERLPALLAYAVVLTGDHDLAADVVQDVMVRAHGRWSRISAMDHPAAYVKRMVTNEYLSWRRRWQVRSVVPVQDDVLAARAPHEADLSARVADRDDAWQRLGALPRRQRVVLTLRYYEGLADAEIAELLGMAPGTVRSDASRALASLRSRAGSRSEEHR